MLADAHANLPALEAALDALEREQCDLVVHLGDVIGIGPHPSECLDLLLGARVDLVMGNHDAWFAFGVEAWAYSDDELAHHRWVHEQLAPGLRKVVAAWPLDVTKHIAGKALLFHPLRPEDGRLVRAAGTQHEGARPRLDVFGKRRRCRFLRPRSRRSTLRSERRYVNTGSVGCHTRSEARAAIAYVKEARVEVCHLSAPYDDRSVFEDLNRRDVPARDFIRDVFFPRS